MLCDPCNLIETNKRGATGHSKLVETGRRKANVIGQNIWLLDYECSECGRRWRLEDDKNDKWAGWSEIRES